MADAIRRGVLAMLITLAAGADIMASDTGMNVWVTDALVKVLPNAAAPANAPKGIDIDAVRNEYESGQVVVTASDRIERLTASVSAFAGPDGPRPRAHVQFEGFVPIRKNTLRTLSEDLVAVAPAHIPDPLLEKRSVSVDAGKNQPIWLTVYVPKTAKPGTYTSTVEIDADGVSRSVPISVQVHDFTLPDDRTLSVTNWLSYGNVAVSHHVELWSEQFWKMLETYARFMADHRQNMIYTPSFQLINGHDDGKGRLTFDFSRFDKWVELFQRAGVVGYIEGTHLGGRKDWALPQIYGSWPAISGPDGKPVSKPETNATSEEYREFLSQYLPALQKHLEEKGWLSIYLQHVNDEPTEEAAKYYQQIASYVHKYAPGIKIMDALECKGLVGAADIWVPLPEYFEKEIAFFRERQKAGDQVWFYTCLHPKGKFMNRFIDYRLIGVRLLHWANYKYGLPGYLHWGLNMYHADPFGNVELDPGTGKPFPPGDSHIIYPGLRGPLSSIRFEAMRDGIEDYELLKLLEKKDAKLAREICDSVVRGFADYTTDPREFRKARNRLLVALDRTAR